MTRYYRGHGFIVELKERKRPDGSTHYDIVNSQGEPFAYAGRLVNSFGGFEKFYEETIETEQTIEELERERGYRPARSVEQQKISKWTNAEQIRNLRLQSQRNYEELKMNGTNETNAKNVCTILRHCLKHAENKDWGELPILSIPYKIKSHANVKKSTGVQRGYYVTAKLAEPIDFEGEPTKHFLLGRRTIGVYKNIDFADGLKDSLR